MVGLRSGIVLFVTKQAAIHRTDLTLTQGHDDATAILLALHCPNIRLLGVSTVWPSFHFVARLVNHEAHRSMAMPVSTRQERRD
jgi:hypothetical protein